VGAGATFTRPDALLDVSPEALRDPFLAAFRERFCESLSAKTPSPRGEVRMARDWKPLPARGNAFDDPAEGNTPESVPEGDAGGGEPQGTRPVTAAGPLAAARPEPEPPPPPRGRLLLLLLLFTWALP
jgi:hypothetical protein